MTHSNRRRSACPRQFLFWILVFVAIRSTVAGGGGENSQEGRQQQQLRTGGSWGGSGKTTSWNGSRGRSSRNSHYNGTRGYHRFGAHKRLMPFLFPVIAIFGLIASLLLMVCGVCPTLSSSFSIFNLHVQKARNKVETSIKKCAADDSDNKSKGTILSKPWNGPQSGVYEAQYEENFRTFHSTATIVFTPILNGDCEDGIDVSENPSKGGNGKGNGRLSYYHLKGSGIDRDGNFEIIFGMVSPDGTAFWLEQFRNSTVNDNTSATSCAIAAAAAADCNSTDQQPQQLLIHGKFHWGEDDDQPKLENYTSFTGSWRSTEGKKGDFIWFKYKEGSSQDSPIGVRQNQFVFAPSVQATTTENKPGITADLLEKNEKVHNDSTDIATSTNKTQEIAASYTPPLPTTKATTSSV